MTLAIYNGENIQLILLFVILKEIIYGVLQN